METKIKKISHIRVEYDTEYAGGNYDKVGSFALIPHSVVDEHYGDVAEAFEDHMKIKRQYMIYYTKDEVFDQNGERMEEED